MSLGPLELAMLAAIALLFFGPAKLPQLGKSIGEAIRGFKGVMNDMSNEINRPEPSKTAADKPATDKTATPSTADTDAAQSAPQATDAEKKQKEKDPPR